MIDQRWVNTGGSPTDKDRYKYGYDRNSNRQWRRNTVASGLDELYAYDNVNRLITMKRGTLSGTPPVITSPANQQNWTLDPTGNWDDFITQTSGTPDLDQTRTQNKVNEITAISASVGTTWATPAYDAAGNMTTMPKPSSLGNSYTATYDAWNRMVQVKDGGTAIAIYGYDGRNRRIKVDTGVVRHFYFTNSWQDVEERLGSLTSAERQYVWGIRYIDELVCRDRASSGSSSSSSSSSSGGAGLNERLYACQDANFNVTSLLDTSANVAERYTYDPYGTPTFRNASWADIGTSAKASTILYAGYKYDPETGLYCVRYRLYHSIVGTWLSRDWVEYVSGSNLFAYVLSNPIVNIDMLGLDPANTTTTKPSTQPTGNKTRFFCIIIAQDDDLLNASKNWPEAKRSAALAKVKDYLDSTNDTLAKCCQQWKLACNARVWDEYEGSNSPGKAGPNAPDYDFDKPEIQRLMMKNLQELERRNKGCVPVIITTHSIKAGGRLNRGITLAQPGLFGQTNYGIYIDIDHFQANVLGHELGHYCGASNCPGYDKGGHSPDSKNIMAAGATGSDVDECYCQKLEDRIKKG